MTIDRDFLEATVRRLVSQLTDQPADQECGNGIFADMDSAIAAARVAARQYLSRSLADRRRYVAAIREVMSDEENLNYMSSQAVLETEMGDVAHKYLKNKVAAAGTPGVEDLITSAWSGDDGLTTVEYSPFGVIGAITPTTNPTETITCNSIGMLAAGNAVVFSPHPRCKQLVLWQIRKINDALRAAGAPENLVVTVAEPSMENTNSMISHPDVKLLVATGGPTIVDVVLRSGKKAIGAGAGNPPVVVDETAELAHAAKCIVDGASFDNNLPCTSEKVCIAVESIADLLKFNLLKEGCYEATADEVARLESLVLTDKGPKLEWVGKPATQILQAIGVEPPAGLRLIICETAQSHPFAQHELMMPILPIVRVTDADTAIDLACELEHGNRHTAIMHSQNVSNLTQMGRKIQTTIFVKNGPSFAGIGVGGEGYTTFTIAGPTGEGLTRARNFARVRRCAMVGNLNVR